MAYYITGLLTVRTGGLTGGEHRMILENMLFWYETVKHNIKLK